MNWKTKGEEQGVKTENSIKQKAIGVTDSFCFIHSSVFTYLLNLLTFILYCCNFATHY